MDEGLWRWILFASRFHGRSVDLGVTRPDLVHPPAARICGGVRNRNRNREQLICVYWRRLELVANADDRARG